MAEYRDVNGVRTWWDELGAGEPAVLLHGGLTDGRDFSGNLDRLSSRFHLYLPERRGHGHTPDVDGPLSIEVMTEDAIAFIEQVCGGGPIRLVGYSAGANVALHIAVKRQDLIERLGLISGAFHPDGMLVKPTVGGSPPPALLEAYAEVSPDGAEHFPVIIAKVAAASDAWTGLSPQALASVEVRTLVVAADDDLVSLEHTVELYEALPAAALAVIPHASHLLLHEHPDALTQLVGDFLSEDPPVRMMPIRRKPA